MVARYLVCLLCILVINCSCIAMEQENVLQEQAPQVIQMNSNTCDSQEVLQEEDKDICSDRCMCCCCPVLWLLMNYDDCDDVEITM